MKIVRIARRAQDFTRERRAHGERIGLVPTMGALHDGHSALVRRARHECDRVIASIFVNPLQFGPQEDFARYPRDPARDHRLLRREGVDLLFEPRGDFYPEGFATHVRVAGLDRPLCGRFRPGHFEGVATVVAKLLVATEPDRLYLGQKDYQQAVLLRRLCRDLDFSADVRIVPTVREADGLALSSRNRYLSAAERRVAPALYQALRATAEALRAGDVRTSAGAARLVRRMLGSQGIQPRFEVQYVEALDAMDLSEREPLQGKVVLAAAAYLGTTRLIDNVLVRIAPRNRARGRR